MLKRTFVILSMLIVVSMLLAACSTPQAAPTTAAPAATEVMTEAPAAAGCTDKIGCVEIGASDPIHIAYALVHLGCQCHPGHRLAQRR